MMSPSEQERLCLRVKGLLAGRGNTLAMSKVPLFDFAGLVDSDLLFCTKKKASAFLQAIFTLHCLDDWLKSLSPLLNKSDAQQKKKTPKLSRTPAFSCAWIGYTNLELTLVQHKKIPAQVLIWEAYRKE